MISMRDETAKASWPLIRIVLPLFLGLFAVLVFATLWWTSGRPWFLGPDDRPGVTDFLAHHIAGRLALEGLGASAYDHDVFNRQLEALTGGASGHWLGWPYPPFFILAVVAFALVPYAWSWLAWLCGTAALLVVALRLRAETRPFIALVLCTPASLACIVKGQNGFLSAALIAASLALLDNRRRVSGAALGLLAFKPHFGLVMPILLAATGRWTVFLAASLTVMASALAATAAFGIEIWPVFVDSARSATAGWLTSDTAFAAMQTVYAVAAPWLGPHGAAVLHGLLAVIILASTLAIWRSEASYGTRAAAAIAATFLVAPYAHNHDAVMLGVAAAWLLGDALHPLKRWEAGLVVVALLAPAVTLVIWAGWPGIVAASTILAICWRRRASPGA